MTLRKLLIWSLKLHFISSPFNKLWKMNLSCALGFSSSFICSQYFNESSEADIAKGCLPASLLQARVDEYLFMPTRNLQNFVWILSGKKSSYDSSRLWLFTLDAIFTKFRLYGLQISEQYNNIGLTLASNSLHWSVGKMNDEWNFFLTIKSTLRFLLLSSGIPLVKMPEALIIIPRYLNSWTISNVLLSNKKWCFFSNLPLLLNITVIFLSFWTEQSDQGLHCLLLQEQSDQGLHYLLFYLQPLGKVICSKTILY